MIEGQCHSNINNNTLLLFEQLNALTELDITLLQIKS